MRNLLIFGGGYIGQAFIKCVKAYFTSILYTTRSPIVPTSILFDSKNPVSKHILQQTTHVLITIPPVEGIDLVLKYHQHDICRMPHLKWLGYLSTTAVYGDWHGAWVHEEMPLYPSCERAQQRLAIEYQWLKTAPVHIFRLAGIYGPGRSIFDRIQQQDYPFIFKKGHVFSRMHCDDIARTLHASMEYPCLGGRIYNLADDRPASTKDVLRYAAKLLGIKTPPIIAYEKAQISPFLQTFYNDNRRISNQRIKQELKIDLLYPSYKEGLIALLKPEQKT